MVLDKYSANFLFTLWKRVRKYGSCCTGLTQNVDDLLQSHTAQTMLANSEFLVMLNQASTDRLELAPHLLHRPVRCSRGKRPLYKSARVPFSAAPPSGKRPQGMDIHKQPRQVSGQAGGSRVQSKPHRETPRQAMGGTAKTAVKERGALVKQAAHPLKSNSRCYMGQDPTLLLSPAPYLLYLLCN